MYPHYKKPPSNPYCPYPEQYSPYSFDGLDPLRHRIIGGKAIILYEKNDMGLYSIYKNGMFASSCSNYSHALDAFDAAVRLEQDKIDKESGEVRSIETFKDRRERPIEYVL